MVTMQGSRDEVGAAGAKDGELGDERTDSADDETAATESLFGPGVPTAEQFADDVPLEWLHDDSADP
jgi:hypothetical protein